MSHFVVRRLSTVLLVCSALSFGVQAQSIPDEINGLKNQIASLKETLAELQNKIDKLQRPTAEPGRAGAPGPKGPKGDPGPAGPPGKALDVTNLRFLNGGLEMLDSNGKVSAFMGTTSQGVGGLRLAAGSKDYFSLGTTDSGDGSVILANRQGSSVVSINTDAQNPSRVSLADASGAVRTILVVDRSGLGRVQILSEKDQAAVTIGQNTPGAGGSGQFYDPNGKQAVFVGVNASKSGVLQLSDGGKVRVELGVEHGHGYVNLNSKTVLTGKGSDYAEPFELARRSDAIPGTVMSATKAGPLAPSSSQYDRKVIGVISGAGDLSPGLQLGARSDGTTDLPIAMAGQVYVRVCLEAGTIQPGDLLVSSSTPGVAMRAGDLSRAFGAVIGKALEPYPGEDGHAEGLVRMLVMNR
jgi:hypothetical protein